MTIQVGDKVPEATLMQMTAEGPAPITTAELFGGKKVVLFGVPGAFTPTCSAKHVPSYLANAGALKAKGVDTIACMSVNDAFVMGAWSKDQNVGDSVLMLADGSAELTKSLGLDLDLSGHGMGVRASRFAMIVDDGTVSHLSVEQSSAEMTVTGAEAILSEL